MKSFLIGLASMALFVGCATEKQVATMEGHGARQVYSANYDQVWRAAVDAAQVGDLHVEKADKSQGYIAAGRGMRPHTFGENVGIWVRPLSTGQTQVEVVSRQAGPPALWLKNWQHDVFQAINANLTREASGNVVAEPAGAPAPAPSTYSTTPDTLAPENVAFPSVEPVPPSAPVAPRTQPRLVPEQGFPPIAPPQY